MNDAKEFYENFKDYDDDNISKGDIVISENDLFKLMDRYAQQKVKNTVDLGNVSKCCLDPHNRKMKNSENGISWYCGKCGKGIEQ